MVSFGVLKSAWQESKRDGVPLLSAGVAYYLFLALIPALLAAVLVYGLVFDEDDVQRQIDEFGEALPDEARELLQTQMDRIVTTSSEGLSIGLAVSLVAALWAASAAANGLIRAMNHVYDAEETRGFVKLRGLSLLITLGGTVFIVLSGAALAVVPALLRALEIGTAGRVGAESLRWLLLVAAFLAALAVFYWIGPNRENRRLQWITLGAVVATVLWIIASVGFAFYANNFGSYGATYGSLAGVVVLLLWMYITAYVVLFGGEINAVGEKGAEGEQA